MTRSYGLVAATGGPCEFESFKDDVVIYTRVHGAASCNAKKQPFAPSSFFRSASTASLPKAPRRSATPRLPAAAEVIICPGRGLTDLARRDALAGEPDGEEVQRSISVLAARPRTLPPLPLSRPNEDAWRVRILEVAGRYAVSVWRRLGQRLLYPNEVVEKTLGVSATTRNWNTLCAICAILQGGE